MFWRKALCHASLLHFKWCLLEKFLKMVRAFLYFKTDFYTVVVKATTQYFLSPSFQYHNAIAFFKKLLLCNLGLLLLAFLSMLQINWTRKWWLSITGRGFKTSVPHSMPFSFTWSVPKLILRWRVYLSQTLSRTATPTTVLHTLCYIHKALLDIWHNWEINHHSVKPLKYEVVFYRSIT